MERSVSLFLLLVGNHLIYEVNPFVSRLLDALPILFKVIHIDDICRYFLLSILAMEKCSYYSIHASFGFKVFTIAFPAQQDTSAALPVRACPECRSLAVYRQGVKVRHRHTVGAVATPVLLYDFLSLHHFLTSFPIGSIPQCMRILSRRMDLFLATVALAIRARRASGVSAITRRRAMSSRFDRKRFDRSQFRRLPSRKETTQPSGTFPWACSHT